MVTSTVHRRHAVRAPWFSPARAAAALITLAAAIVYSAVALYRHDRFASNALDLAVQDQTIWGYSRFHVIHNTVLGVPNLLGDHFHPILMVLAPFYWIWDSAGVLLVAQGILVAVAGVPIYMWAEQRLGWVAGLAFLLTYFVFWGILAGVVYDFHHVAFAVPAISAAMYAVLNRRNRLLWSMVVVAMLTREDISLTLIALGLYVVVVQRRYRLGLVLAGLNTAWFALLLGVVMPALVGGPYRHWTYDALGSGPIESAVFVLRHPLASLQLLFVPTHKALVWIGSLLSWAFLPMVSPIALVALPTFLERMWSSSPSFWSFQFQYSMLPAPILAFAAIDTCARIRSMTGVRFAWLSTKLLPIAALVAGTIFTLVPIRPFDEVSTYLSADRAAQIQSCLNTIPSTAGVSASNTLVPHLSHRLSIYAVTANADQDYIAVDPSTYPNFAPGEEDQLRALVRNALASGYGVSCAKGLTLLLARGASGQTLTPDLERWLAGQCGGRNCISH